MAVPPTADAARRVALAPDDTVGAAARTAIGAQLGAFLHEEPGARAGDVEAIHQLRVATRRLRAVLELFRPALPARATTQSLADLEWLGQAIGAVRDLDVLSAAVVARGHRLDDAIQAALSPLEQEIVDRRLRAHATLADVLDAPRARRLVGRLTTLVETDPRGEPARTPCADVVATLCRPLVRAVLRAGRHLDEDASAAALHRLRVRVKRLRYALETLAGLGGEATRKLLRRLASLQALLGDHHDAVTQQAWLHVEARAFTASPEVILAMGALVQVLGRRARRIERRVPAAWRRVDRPKLVAAVRGELAHPTRVRTAA